MVFLLSPVLFLYLVLLLGCNSFEEYYVALLILCIGILGISSLSVYGIY